MKTEIWKTDPDLWERLEEKRFWEQMESCTPWDDQDFIAEFLSDEQLTLHCSKDYLLRANAAHRAFDRNRRTYIPNISSCVQSLEHQRLEMCSTCGEHIDDDPVHYRQFRSQQYRYRHSSCNEIVSDEQAKGTQFTW